MDRGDSALNLSSVMTAKRVHFTRFFCDAGYVKSSPKRKFEKEVRDFCALSPQRQFKLALAQVPLRYSKPFAL